MSKFSVREYDATTDDFLHTFDRLCNACNIEEDNDKLYDFLALLQEVTGFTDEQFKEALYKLVHSQKNPAHLLAWIGVKITGKPQWTGD